MTYRNEAACLRVAAVACLTFGAACGPATTAATSDGGSCSANVPAGQACNTLTNVGAMITPTCDPGSIPTGTGGTIVDGTYTLTAQVYYGGTCTTTGVNATLEIVGDCVQEVSGAPLPTTGSTTHTVSGTSITRTVTCLDVVGVDAGHFSYDTTTSTFTATPTSFTIYIKNSGTSSQNPDRAETYQKM
jgi:hypothetical protein